MHKAYFTILTVSFHSEFIILGKNTLSENDGDGEESENGEFHEGQLIEENGNSFEEEENGIEEGGEGDDDDDDDDGWITPSNIRKV